MLLNFFRSLNHEYYIFLALTLVVVILFFIIHLRFLFDSKRKWNNLSGYLGAVTKTVDSIRYGNLSKKVEKLDIPDFGNLTKSLNSMIEALHDREAMVVEYQNELAKQNKILEAAINSLSDGLLIIDDNSSILRVSSLVSEWFGSVSKDILGASILDFVVIPKNKSVYLLNNDEVFIPTEKASNFTASTVELKLDDKKPRYIVIIKNVTDQIELETLKEDFVATLTHDLKVPIIAETNMIELFLNETFGEISDKQRLALKNMQSSNKELLELVQTVLETYKIGKITLYKENIMLKSFISEIIEEMQPIANKTGNELKFILDRDIRVFADRFHLKRVVKNLIQNAISYGTPKSPIDITIGEIPKYIIIKVKDRGAGISKADIEKIFNKYYSAAKKFRKIGTGLGLYLALQITKAHNGNLTVDSVEGEYTEFCIKIPI